MNTVRKLALITGHQGKCNRQQHAETRWQPEYIWNWTLKAGISRCNGAWRHFPAVGGGGLPGDIGRVEVDGTVGIAGGSFELVVERFEVEQVERGIGVSTSPDTGRTSTRLVRRGH